MVPTVGLCGECAGNDCCQLHASGLMACFAASLPLDANPSRSSGGQGGGAWGRYVVAALGGVGVGVVVMVVVAVAAVAVVVVVIVFAVVDQVSASWSALDQVLS